MTHFIRDYKNRSLFDCDVSKSDLHCATNIKVFADLLLLLNDKNPYVITEFIDEVNDLTEIRGAWLEVEEWKDNYKNIDDFVADCFKQFATKWNLSYVTD